MDDYMARWDGPPFFDAIGNVAGKTVLDVGVGNGRIARIILDRGCSYFTGLDLSARTLEKTKLNLGDGALVYDSAVVLNAVTKDGVVTFKSSFHSLGMILPEPG
jgi:2-polyprenyl-3-methyl-5-hydroxy-6-metoxy-1,4-benzoquinol methylase